jgi:outer membrane receptor protein involved in Fe transport
MKLVFAVLLSLLASFSFAQSGIVRGTVIDDATGETIIGANVVIAGTSTGTATDLDGQFSIETAPGVYELAITYISYQTLTISKVVLKPDEVTLLGEIRLKEDQVNLGEVIVTAEAIKTTEIALLTVKKKSAVMMDGISSAKMEMIGDATAVEAAKRVTGVSVEDGKYVYVRGLGDRYSKTTLNNMDIPGLDPDKNSLQMDIFPTNLIDNIVVSKNFTADMPADFTGGLVNVQTKDFPEKKIFSISVGTTYNPDMHFNPDYLTYNGGSTDFLGFDDGTRALPEGAKARKIPTPISGASKEEVSEFIGRFSPELGARRQTSPMDFSAGISLGNQINLKKNAEKNPKLGYIFSLGYKSDYKYYDDVTFGEYQRLIDPDQYEMRYATIQTGELGERNVLIGTLAGLAYKTQLTKIRLMVMHLQNGESRAGKFRIDNDGEAVGQSGYIAESDNLEYNQRSLTNVYLSGLHVLKQSGWEIDWRVSPTLSLSNDPDIRKTAFTLTPVDTLFVAGAGGNPARIWRSLSEINAMGRIDVTKKYKFMGQDARLKFGASHSFKYRDYEILFFDIQFFGGQSWDNPDPTTVLNPENIFPNKPNSIYYQSGNNFPNPNAYESNVNNTGLYVSNEFRIIPKLNTILGLRAENFVQRHTGRDQRYASGDTQNGRNLDNEVVLNSLDLFPTANLIYSLTEDQNLRLGYSRTIARPSFKELSFAQILDPITNRIFNGSLFTYNDWAGQLTETRIDNIDFRWEMYMPGGQIISLSAFYKRFDNPIELVRIPEQQTSTEFQPRNVGDGRVYGAEFEFRKDLGFISSALTNFNVSGNITIVESIIDMTNTEFNSRKTYEKTGETITNQRQMAGQAPYVINAGLSYTNASIGLDAGFFYNVKGQTLSIVGAGLFPDIYFQPFHSLNFSLNKKIGKEQNTTIDFRVANILNDRLESLYQSFQAEGQVFNSINPGRAFSLGLSHRF